MFVSLCYFDFQADALFMELPPVLGLYPSTQQLGSTSFLLAPVKFWACFNQPNSDYMSTSEQGGSSLARPWRRSVELAKVKPWGQGILQREMRAYVYLNAYHLILMVSSYWEDDIGSLIHA